MPNKIVTPPTIPDPQLAALLDVWQQIPAFLVEAKQRTLAKKSVAKMAEAWTAKTLRAELLFCKSFGKAFHDASFELEGDGFCLPYVYQHVARILQLQADVARDRDDVHVRLTADHEREPVAHDGVVVGDQHVNPRHGLPRTFRLSL